MDVSYTWGNCLAHVRHRLIALDANIGPNSNQKLSRLYDNPPRLNRDSIAAMSKMMVGGDAVVRIRASQSFCLQSVTALPMSNALF